MGMFLKQDVSPFLLRPYLQEQNISSQDQARTAPTGPRKMFLLQDQRNFCASQPTRSKKPL
jgi:hypothetical protein